MKHITWDEFKKIEIRVGTIIEVNDFPEAIKSAYQIKVDLGKKIGPFNSECLITGFYNKDNKVILAIPEKLIPNGTRLE